MEMVIKISGLRRSGIMEEYEVPLEEGTTILEFRDTQKILKGLEKLKVTIPEGIKTIGYGAFFCFSELAEVVMPDSITLIKSRAFFNCKDLRDIRFSLNLLQIEFEAFAGCESLRDLNFPESLEKIEFGAFS